MWRVESFVGAMLLATWIVPHAAMAGGTIPYRQEGASSALQLGAGYLSAIALLALLALGLFFLKKRLGTRLPGLLAAPSGLQCVASLRMPMRTSVHVVSWRGREVMFAQCGDQLRLLDTFEALGPAEDARP